MTFSGTDGHMTRSEGSRPVIELRHLTKRYGPILAVDDLSFMVAAGQVTGFLGPNGSGKSTTMRMIVGLDAPTAGQVTVADRGHRARPGTAGSDSGGLGCPARRTRQAPRRTFLADWGG